MTSELKKLSVAEEVLKEIESLRSLKKLIIVEGNKDISSLNKLGLTNIKKLNKPIFEIIDGIEEEVAILTDLDGEGKKLYSLIKSSLQRKGIKVDDKLRKLIFKTPVRHIEGLFTYLEKWKSAQE